MAIVIDTQRPQQEANVPSASPIAAQQIKADTSALERMKSVGSALAGFADVVGDAYDKEVERSNRLRAQDALNGYLEKQQDLKSGKGGYQHLEKKNVTADDLLRDYGQRDDKNFNDASGELGNSAQRRYFQASAENYRGAFRRGIIDHVGRQGYEFDKEIAGEGSKSASNLLLQSRNEKEAAAHKEGLMEALKVQARLEGHSSDWVRNQYRAGTSAYVVSQFGSSLAQKAFGRCANMLEQALKRDEITGKDYAACKERLRVATAAAAEKAASDANGAQAFAAAVDIAAKTMRDDGTLDLQKALSECDKRYGKDPKMYSKVRTKIYEKYNDCKAGVAETQAGYDRQAMYEVTEHKRQFSELPDEVKLGMSTKTREILKDKQLKESAAVIEAHLATNRGRLPERGANPIVDRALDLIESLDPAGFDAVKASQQQHAMRAKGRDAVGQLYAMKDADTERFLQQDLRDGTTLAEQIRLVDKDGTALKNMRSIQAAAKKEEDAQTKSQVSDIFYRRAAKKTGWFGGEGGTQKAADARFEASKMEAVYISNCAAEERKLKRPLTRAEKIVQAHLAADDYNTTVYTQSEKDGTYSKSMTLYQAIERGLGRGQFQQSFSSAQSERYKTLLATQFGVPHQNITPDLVEAVHNIRVSNPMLTKGLRNQIRSMTYEDKGEMPSAMRPGESPLGQKTIALVSMINAAGGKATVASVKKLF